MIDLVEFFVGVGLRVEFGGELFRWAYLLGVYTVCIHQYFRFAHHDWGFVNELRLLSSGPDHHKFNGISESALAG